jgi:N-acetylmuramoyl-L-alanine amidase
LKFKGTAVLIEPGFISNDKDREKIISPLTRSTVCEGTVDVIQKFFKGNVKEAQPAADKLHLHGGAQL